MGKYFGTDGFRGEAGVTLTADIAFRMGRILGRYYGRSGARARVVIGKDTRRSCYMLEYAIAAGLAASGADAYMLHVITTPGVSYVCASEGFDLGVMISASHNPYTDNGIKLIDSRGEKLSDSVIEELEALMDSDEPIPSAAGSDIGRIIDHYSGRNRYIGYLISVARNSFSDMRVVLDCANGAAFNIAVSVFGALGARVLAIGNEPNGENINRGVGSTHPELLREEVVRQGADIGFAFDGDGDRCIAADEEGREVNGDQILYMLARKMKHRGELVGNTVVSTVMSNLGLSLALRAAGIREEQTTVGDRYVYERMKERGYALGGEQSGHIIMRKYATTGDGILTAIAVAEAVLESGQRLSRLTSEVRMLPQTTVNVRVRDKRAAREREAVQKALAAAEERLRGVGRILLRESGTEPVLRVMVEANSRDACREIAEDVARIIGEGEEY